MDIVIAWIGVADEVPRAVVGKLGVGLLECHLHVVAAEELRLIGVLQGIEIEGVEVVVVVFVAFLPLLHLVGRYGGLEDVAAPGVEDAVGGHSHPRLTHLALGALLGVIAIDDQGHVGEVVADVAHAHVEWEGDELPTVGVQQESDCDVVGPEVSVVDDRGVGGRAKVAAVSVRPCGEGIPHRFKPAC